MGTEALAEAFRELGGVQRAIEGERLQILAVLDEREAWRADGALDAGQWVAATDAVPAPDGRVLARVAARLVVLPALREASAEGRVSLAQLRWLVELADETSDEQWAKDGPSCSPAALERLVKQRRRVSPEEAAAQHRRRSFRWWEARHGHGVRFAGLLPHDAAEIVKREITARAQELGPDEHGVFEPFESRCADALVEAFGSAAGDAGRPEIVVHVPVGLDRSPTLPDGTPLSLETVRRLACDATGWLLVENPDGTVAGYGRRRRLVPEKMRARLQVRDGVTCVFRSCDRRRGLRAHHIAWWDRDRGETEEDNCLLLCPAHHHLVHEGGWTISGNPRDGTLRFHRPGGGPAVPAEHAPTAADTDLLRRLGVAAA
jgi:hypothetical protein